MARDRSIVVRQRQVDHANLADKVVFVSDYEDVRELVSDFVERPEALSGRFGQTVYSDSGNLVDHEGPRRIHLIVEEFRLGQGLIEGDSATSWARRMGRRLSVAIACCGPQLSKHEREHLGAQSESRLSLPGRGSSVATSQATVFGRHNLDHGVAARAWQSRYDAPHVRRGAGVE